MIITNRYFGKVERKTLQTNIAVNDLLVLVLAIVFGQIINIGIGNTFHKYC